MLFGTIPLNLTTTRTLHLENTGDCLAYFQVMSHIVTVQGSNVKVEHWTIFLELN